MRNTDLHGILLVLSAGPDGADDVEQGQYDHGDVDGRVLVEVCVAEDEPKVQLVWLHHPATAKRRQMVTAAFGAQLRGGWQHLGRSKEHVISLTHHVKMHQKMVVRFRCMKSFVV